MNDDDDNMRAPNKEQNNQFHPNDRRKRSLSFSSYSSLSQTIVLDLHAAITTRQRLVVLRKLEKLLIRGTSESNHNNSDLTNTNTSCLSNDVQQHQHDEDITNNCSMDGHTISQTSSSTTTTSATVPDLIQCGIANALTIQLNTLVNRHGSHHTQEIPHVCHCLALIFHDCRRSQDVFVAPILERQVEGPHFCSLLAQVLALEDEEKIQMGSNHNNNNSRWSIATIVNVLSSDPRGCRMLVQCQSLMERWTNILQQSRPREDLLSVDCVLEILSSFKNMTYYEEDFRRSLIIQGKDQHLNTFLDGLAQTSARTDLSIKALQRISSILRNLATAIECHTQLTRKPLLIAILVRLTSQSSHTQPSSSSDTAKLQRNILDTLTCLAMDPDSSLLLILHGQGVLLHMLQRFLTTATDAALRKKSASALRLLSTATSAPLLLANKDLVYALSTAALQDACPQVRREATQAFSRLGSCCSPSPDGTSTCNNNNMDSMLNALTVLAQSALQPETSTETDFTTQVVGNTLLEQITSTSSSSSSLLCANRTALAERTSLLIALAQLALRNSSHHNISTIFYHLTQEAALIPLVVAQPVILDAILHDACHNRHRHAILTLIQLASSSPAALARHPTLLPLCMTLVRSMERGSAEQRGNEDRAELVRALTAICAAL